MLLPLLTSIATVVVALFKGDEKFISDHVRVIMSDCQAVRDALLYHRVSICIKNL